MTQGAALPASLFAQRTIGDSVRQLILWAIGLLMLLALVAKAYYGLPEGGMWATTWGWAGVGMNAIVLLSAIFLKPRFRL